MVVFTCNHCGETLQKPKVAKHYEFQCRTAPFLTCVDCFKDFRGEEYVAHTKCITEAERYGGKDYVPKAGANKGERKQQEWINIVNGILNNSKNLSNAERNFLNTLSKYENIPRKKVKFLNFVKNALGNKVNSTVIDSVWDKLETAYKNNLQKQQNDEGDHKVDNRSNISEHQESNIIENQNNENTYKENQNDEQPNKNNNDANNVSKKKKSKKRKADEAMEENTVEPVSKKKGKIMHTEDQVENSVSKKRNTSIVLSESSVNQNGEGQPNEKTTFDWKGTILDIVRNKGEISLKKLQKKVISQYMKFCSNEVTNEKASIRFNKKLKKVSGVLISDEKVKLA
ncbi:uncharacterized protein LOC143355406 [Halictus rubicundus]|uniref:uncharacterized protein LOC143355406 n=1 Tax=Halictus rubicundus TaxID=77578 RepID=UPI00403685B0